MMNVISGINLRLFYRSRASVLRSVNTKASAGATKQELQLVEELVVVPCRISVNQLDNNLSQQVDQNPVQVVATLFCDVKYLLREGDVYDVTAADGETSRWIGGAPVRHEVHQEVRVVQRSRA
ncbi:MAG: hypothetical protein FWE76_01940 [Symbiobacteriaceae bacterium]|nr:hypothetical protein [Symbiobacteriaceae bacterium]